MRGKWFLIAEITRKVRLRMGRSKERMVRSTQVIKEEDNIGLLRREEMKIGRLVKKNNRKVVFLWF